MKLLLVVAAALIDDRGEALHLNAGAIELMGQSLFLEGGRIRAADPDLNASIADGDLVVVRRQEDAQNGDIVAAMLDGEATVKTLKRSDGHAWLLPHNPAYAPILGDEASILGRVIAVLRRV